jgi:hypothetical protein
MTRIQSSAFALRFQNVKIKIIRKGMRQDFDVEADYNTTGRSKPNVHYSSVHLELELRENVLRPQLPVANRDVRTHLLLNSTKHLNAVLGGGNERRSNALHSVSGARRFSDGFLHVGGLHLRSGLRLVDGVSQSFKLTPTDKPEGEGEKGDNYSRKRTNLALIVRNERPSASSERSIDKLNEKSGSNFLMFLGGVLAMLVVLTVVESRRAAKRDKRQDTNNEKGGKRG